MSNPPEITNLSDKFAALREQMTTQHNALLLKIDDLRGLGPENTIKSINQSIWNLAGPAPGRSLTDIYGLLSNINNGLGGFPDGATAPGGLQLLSARDYLTQINNSAAFLSIILEATGYSGGETLLSTLAALLLQFNTSVVYPTMKDLMLTISQQQAALVSASANPLTTLPTGVCAQPFVSAYTSVIPVSGINVTPLTVARWDFSGTTEFEEGQTVGISGDMLIKTTAEPIDWSGYRFYVASKAQMFGALYLDTRRFPTNQWVTLPYSQSLSFSVDGDENDIKVYICGAGDAPAGACPGSQDPLTVTSWWKPTNGPIPLRTTWYARSWTGGSTWSTNHSAVVAGETYSAFIITRSDATVDLCISWDVSNDATVQEIGIHVYDLNISGQIAQSFQDIVISQRGVIGKTVFSLNFDGWQLSEIALIPYCACTGGTLPPNVTIAIAYLPPGSLS